jgi:hypothetical protein
VYLFFFQKVNELIFLFIIFKLIIKISSLNNKSLNQEISTTTPKISLFIEQKPIVKHLKSFNKNTISPSPPTIVTTPTTMVSSSSNRQIITKKPDNLMIRILNLLKSNSRNQLTIGSYRMKSLCSNSYISFRKSTVVATATEDIAFSSKQCKYID